MLNRLIFFKTGIKTKFWKRLKNHKNTVNTELSSVNNLEAILIPGSNYAIPEKKMIPTEYTTKLCCFWRVCHSLLRCVVSLADRYQHFWVTSCLRDLGSRTTQNVGTYLPEDCNRNNHCHQISSLLGELHKRCYSLWHQPDSSSLSWWGSHSPSWETRLLGRECEGLGEAFSWLRRWLSCITWSCSRDLCSSRRNRSRSSSRSFIIFCNGHSTLLEVIILITVPSYIKKLKLNSEHRTPYVRVHLYLDKYCHFYAHVLAKYCIIYEIINYYFN
jgi:hypothetical protein